MACPGSAAPAVEPRIYESAIADFFRRPASVTSHISGPKQNAVPRPSQAFPRTYPHAFSRERVYVLLPTITRLVLLDFYCEFENDPGGYGYLLLELRAYVCGTRVGEVVAGSGGVATAKCLCCVGAVRGPRERFGHYREGATNVLCEPKYALYQNFMISLSDS